MTNKDVITLVMFGRIKDIEALLRDSIKKHKENKAWNNMYNLERSLEYLLNMKSLLEELVDLIK